MARSSLAVIAILATAVLGPGGPAAASQPAIGTWLAHFKAHDTMPGDWFGWGVAASGDTILVGAPKHANKAGRAYVFTKGSHGWRETAELTGSDTDAGDFFGEAVALSGTTAVVAAPGYASKAGNVYVFSKGSSGWRQVAELNKAASAPSPSAIAVSGETVVVGSAVKPDLAGRVDVFTKTSVGWVRQTELQAPNAGHAFGQGLISVAISGATIVVGGGARDGAFVYTRAPRGWGRTAVLPSTGISPYGYSVAVSGPNIVLSAPSARADGRTSLHVFTRTANGWEQVASSRPGVLGFIPAVAISGRTIIDAVVGLRIATGIYIYTQTSKGWRLAKALLGPLYQYGYVPAVSGPIAVVMGSNLDSVYVLHV